jgi:hypothetical protein
MTVIFEASPGRPVFSSAEPWAHLVMVGDCIKHDTGNWMVSRRTWQQVTAPGSGLTLALVITIESWP